MMVELLVAHQSAVTIMPYAIHMKIAHVVTAVEILGAHHSQTATIMDIVIGTKTVPAQTVARTITDALTAACAATSR